jgi:hypothetical protein
MSVPTTVGETLLSYFAEAKPVIENRASRTDARVLYL